MIYDGEEIRTPNQLTDAVTKEAEKLGVTLTKRQINTWVRAKLAVIAVNVDVKYLKSVVLYHDYLVDPPAWAADLAAQITRTGKSIIGEEST